MVWIVHRTKSPVANMQIPNSLSGSHNNSSVVQPCEWYRLVAARNRQKSIKPLTLAFKVIEFGTNQEPVYDFLLVINSNLGPILHHYWDTVTYWPKIANFAHLPSHLVPAFGVTSFRIYGRALWFLKESSRQQFFQAADGEDLMILSCTVFDWSTCVTDIRTDGQTDGQTELRWLRHAESSSCFRA